MRTNAHIYVCETCRYWGEDEDESSEWEAISSGCRLCTRALPRWIIMDRANDGVKYAPMHATEDDEKAWCQRRLDALREAKLYVQDGSEYRAELYTAPDFGCVLYGPKGSEDAETTNGQK